MPADYKRSKRILRSSLMVVFSIALLMGAFRLTGAGSLTPPGVVVAPTMNSTQEAYEALVGSGSFDSTLVVQDDNGNALEISKCIIDVVNGGPGCP